MVKRLVGFVVTVVVIGCGSGEAVGQAAAESNEVTDAPAIETYPANERGLLQERLERLIAAREKLDPGVGTMTSQRDTLRQLVQRFGKNEGRLIQEYAAAEKSGLVRRESNAYNLTPEEYAARLIADARKKGWITGL